MSLYETDDQESTTDLDSHADTCVVGKNALITLDFETPVRVTGYDKLKAKSYRTRPQDGGGAHLRGAPSDRNPSPSTQSLVSDAAQSK